MKKIIFYTIFFIRFCAETSAQNYQYIGYDVDTALNIIRTAHFDRITKECVLINSAQLLTGGDDYNYFIFRTHFTKFDSNLNILIDKSFQLRNQSIRIRGSIKLHNGNYLAYGLYYNSKSSSNELSGVDACIIEYSSNGDTICTKVFPYLRDYSDIGGFVQLRDHSFAFVCFLTGIHREISAYRIVRLDTNYNVVSDSLYYDSDNNISPKPLAYYGAIEKTEDGAILIGGNKYTGQADTTERALIFKVDTVGRVVWEKTFYPNEDDFTCITSIQKLKDGNYLAVGFFDSRYFLDPGIESYVFLVKFNSDGETIWKKFFYKFRYQFFFDVEEFNNGDILLAGQMDQLDGVNGYEGKAVLFCINTKGNIKWTRQYHNPPNIKYNEVDESYFSDVFIADNNRILALGNILTNDSRFPYNNGTDQDFIFLYADSLGCIDPSNCAVTLVEHVPVVPKYFYVYPNPSSTNIHFSTNLEFTNESKLSIYNALGQLVHQVHNLTNDTSIELSTFSKGIYFVELQQGEGERFTQRLVVE